MWTKIYIDQFHGYRNQTQYRHVYIPLHSNEAKAWMRNVMGIDIRQRCSVVACPGLFYVDVDPDLIVLTTQERLYAERDLLAYTLLPYVLIVPTFVLSWTRERILSWRQEQTPESMRLRAAIVAQQNTTIAGVPEQQ